MSLLQSHSIFSSPFSCSGFEFCFVILVDLSNLWNQRIIWVSISQKRADWKKYLWNCESWWPLFLENVQTDWTIWIDVWMVDSRCEVDLCWLEGIVSGEVDVEEEDSTRVWRIIWSHDGCLPMIRILLINWSSWAVCRWVLSKIDKLLLNSLDSWHLY